MEKVVPTPTTVNCIHYAFERQVRRTPDAVAVRHGTREITYANMNAWANTIARQLAVHGVTVGDRVGLYAYRSAETIAAMLGVLKAGAAYVPLEASLPAHRLRTMARTVTKVLLAVAPLQWDITDTVVLAVDSYEDAFGGGDPAPVPDPGVPVDPEDLLYVPYTSGSTGEPKGVEVPHRSAYGLLADPDLDQAWCHGETVLHHSALSWDAHLLEIYPALLSGGCVWVFPGDSRDPGSVVSYARQHEVTLLVLPTQAFATVVSTDPGAFSWSPTLIIGGEAVRRDQLAAALVRTPNLEIVNVYGPVECTCLATAHRITPEDLDRPAIPIGQAVGDRRVHVLDEAGNPVATGMTGELYISGDCVARGYWTKPGLTAEAFVPDPFSGTPGARMYRTGDIARRNPGGWFDFLGRADDQVKLRGFRVELSEVAAAMRSHPAVVDAVAAIDGTDDLARLVGYAVVADDAVLDTAELRGYLKQRLTPIMVPSVIVELDEMPTTETGKLDRRALPVPPARGAGPNFAPATTAIERRVADIWREILDVARVGRNDDFFEIGGNSLVGMRAVLRIREAFGDGVEIRHLYEAPTVSELAKVIEQLQTAQQIRLAPIVPRLSATKGSNNGEPQWPTTPA